VTQTIELVNRLWDVFRRDGVEGVLALVDPDVHWRPFAAGGRTFRGAEELRGYFHWMRAAEETQSAEVLGLEAHGDAVLVSGRLHRITANEVSVTDLVWLYRFREGRLVGASAHGSRAAALAAADDGAGHDAPESVGDAPPSFAVRMVWRAPDEVVLGVTGALDLATGSVLEDAVQRVDAPRRLLDLRAVTFLDVAGLHTLVRVADRAAADGVALTIHPPGAAAARVIGLVGAEATASLPLAPAA